MSSDGFLNCKSLFFVSFQNSVYLNGKSCNHQQRSKPDSAKRENAVVPDFRIVNSVHGVSICTHHQDKSGNDQNQADQHPFEIFFSEVERMVLRNIIRLWSPKLFC